MSDEVNEKQTKAANTDESGEMPDAETDEVNAGVEQRQFTLVSNIMKNRSDSSQDQEKQFDLTTTAEPTD